MKRFEDWPKRLSDFLNSRRNTPFCLGSNDCVLFALDAVCAITGTDLGARIRGTYSDEEGAARVLTDELLASLVAENDIQEIPVLMAQRGDVLLCVSKAGRTMLVVGMDGTRGYGPSGDGAKAGALVEDCAKAWRI